MEDVREEILSEMQMKVLVELSSEKSSECHMEKLRKSIMVVILVLSGVLY